MSELVTDGQAEVLRLVLDREGLDSLFTSEVESLLHTRSTLIEALERCAECCYESAGDNARQLLSTIHATEGDEK